MYVDNYQYMKTIGYFGDSFCTSKDPQSWCVLLANKLDAEIINYGEEGKSIWTTFFNFKNRIKQDTVPDISIFCWTEPYRLYHPDLILSANTIPKEGSDPKVYQALEDYWKYLHNYDKDELAYEYAIKYFDQNILSKVNKQIVQMWSFRPFETAKKDADIKLTTGVFIDESMFDFSKGKGSINHMTAEQNQQWADKVYEQVTG